MPWTPQTRQHSVARLLGSLQPDSSHTEGDNPPLRHPGWLLAYGLCDQSGRHYVNEAGAELGQRKATVLNAVAQAARHIELASRRSQDAPWYTHALARWAQLTSDKSRFATAVWHTAQRVFLGAGEAGVLETGVSLHHTYGLPYLPGSALKGCARAYAEMRGLDAAYVAALFGRAPEDPHGASPDAETGESGCVIFHDAWWIPSAAVQRAAASSAQSASPPARGPLELEVVTPHHIEYYVGTQKEPLDTDAPVPTHHLAMAGAFYFVIEGDPAWAQAALRLLAAGLSTLGIGAKRASGYGCFITAENDPANGPALQVLEQLQRRRAQAAQRQAQQNASPLERVAGALLDLDDAKLTEKLGKDRAKLLADLQVDEGTLREGARRVVESRPALLQRWQAANKKSDKAAYKAFRFVFGGASDDGADDS